MLKSAEIEIKKEHQVLMVNKTTSFKKQGKSKGKNKKSGKKAATPPVKPKTGPKPDAECYYCKEKGHWKRNCSKYLADLKSGLVKKKKEDTDIEGKSPGWHHWWDRVRTPSSGDDSPPPLDSAEEWQAVEEEAEVEGSEEATVAAARAKAEVDAKAKAKVKAQPATTVNDEEDTSSSDASTDTASSEEVTSRKRQRDEDDEAGPSKKKKKK
ncbi:hypothetical protein QYE76_040713 [Lolium multiflorum]|uniref:CCHC-type domain-containing protein n=1 Tax=Lolium multiflorum TaxID=4521 RepID=A0AAD8TBM9_LOLMU|nr:hypothetical protein QYE76_040713 [Lolium multiflorum]